MAKREIIVTKEEVLKEILIELQKDNTTRDGKLIIREEQIPPILKQESHPTYKSCKNKVYQRKYKQVIRSKSYENENKEQVKVPKHKFAVRNRRGGKLKKWSEDEYAVLRYYVKNEGYKNGLHTAAYILKRSYNACRCKFDTLENKDVPTQSQVIKNTTPEIKPISLDISKDIANLDIQGYKIKITYKNGSVFTYNMETQQISIK